MPFQRKLESSAAPATWIPYQVRNDIHFVVIPAKAGIQRLFPVIPAKAGIQWEGSGLDSGLRQDDNLFNV
jgi:hypothetical protein